MRNPLVIGERLYLRPLEASDAEQRARDLIAERDTFMQRGRFLPSPLAVERWIVTTYERQPPDYLAFAVCLRVDDRLIGVVDLEEIDYLNRTAETGSWIAPAEYRNQGYGTEAKHLLLEYAFDVLHLHVLLSTVFEPNTRSVAALLKQGYRLAGRIKWHDVKDGFYRDMLYFDVTRDDWLAARATWRAGRAQPE